MRPYLSIIIICILWGALFTCGKSRQDAEQLKAETEKVKRPPTLTERIPPERCRLVGTVVKIDERYRVQDPKDPCSKAPCRAVVRIDEVIGYGQAFGRPLATGREITVLFKFTVIPTKDIIPEMTVHYPGLETGSLFRADVESLQGDRRGTTDFSYVVYGYEVLKQ
ncbi:hypothetical protein ACFL6L_04270 [candidate division KSB1 bacterium]